jgi:hypothetical protein
MDVTQKLQAELSPFDGMDNLAEHADELGELALSFGNNYEFKPTCRSPGILSRSAE